VRIYPWGVSKKIKMKVYYNPKLKELARRLRENMTLSEVLLWNNLKQEKYEATISIVKNRSGSAPRRVDNYIVDFFCPRLKLIIEIDGETHIYKGNKDLKRQNKLESFGFHFLRFKDVDVKKDMKNVLVSIENWIEECDK